MKRAFQVTQAPIYRREEIIRDPLYLRFVKRLPCVACGGTWMIDPAHTGPHALGRKASDGTAIPLCRRCHIAFDSDPRGFAERQKLDVPALTDLFQHLWSLRK